ncbi:MAG: hypothetical protein RI988_3461 [Pseudomonadota bacterium]
MAIDWVQVEEVLERMRKGVLMHKALRQLDIPPTRWRDWRRQDPALEQAVQEAKEVCYDIIAEESLDIVDGLAPVEGVPTEASRDKARADHRLRLLARLDPRRYGERTQLADAEGNKLQLNPAVIEVMALLRPVAPMEALQKPQEALEGVSRPVPLPEPRKALEGPA